MEITAEELEKLSLEAESEIALQLALSYVSKMMHTEKQTRDYLKKKGFLNSVINNVVTKLIGYKYLDDEAYLKAYVNAHKARKGAKKIAYELKNKGINNDLIESGFKDVEDDDDGAFRIADNFFKNKEVTYELSAKCYRRLLSRGFSYETAKRAVDRVKQNNENN